MTTTKYLILKTALTLIIGFWVFLSIGCWEYKQKTALKAPIVKHSPDDKIYTLKLSNGYNTSACYAMTEKLADRYLKHLNSCPIPLMVRTYEEYKDQYISKVVKKYDKYNSVDEFAGSNVVGQHVAGWPVKGWSSYFIFIAARPSPHALMATYFHEMGHYDCNTNKCPHCKAHGHKHVTELHAIINGLECAIEYDFPEVMEALFTRYGGWLSDADTYRDYQEYGDAVLTIQKSDLWKTVKKYAKKHKMKVPTYKKPKESKKAKTIRIYLKFAA